MANITALATQSSNRYIACYEKIESALGTNGFNVYFDYLESVSKTSSSYNHFLQDYTNGNDTSIVKFNIGTQNYLLNNKQVLTDDYDVSIGCVFFSTKTTLKEQFKDLIYKMNKLMFELLEFTNDIGFNALKLVNFDFSSNCLNEFKINTAPLKSSQDVFAFKLKFKFNDSINFMTIT